MNLIILKEQDKLSGDTYILKDNRAEHIRTILKLSVDDKIEIGILNGSVGKAVIDKISETGIRLKITDLSNPPQVSPIIDLICALPRPQTLKKILFTSAMMNVRQLHLVRANRVEKSYYQSPLLEKNNYEPFLLEGLAQGKFTRIPEVVVHQKFKPFFEDTLIELESKLSKKRSIKLLPDLGAGYKLPNFLNKEIDHLFIAIGPEGGWVPFEIEIMKKKGFQCINLGPWTLRVEHAVTAVLAQAAIFRGSK
ncbi:16S rRNA (uracil(1498)-N(3))-methyltransferase [Candidatus Zixiibacteriota bacterium]